MKGYMFREITKHVPKRQDSCRGRWMQDVFIIFVHVSLFPLNASVLINTVKSHPV